MKNTDLDKLVKKRFEGFTEQPHERVWQSIEASLDHKKKSRAPFWWRLAGIASIFILFFYLINPFSKETSTDQSTTIIEENSDIAVPVLKQSNKNIGTPHTTEKDAIVNIKTDTPLTRVEYSKIKSSTTSTSKAAKAKRKSVVVNGATVVEHEKNNIAVETNIILRSNNQFIPNSSSEDGEQYNGEKTSALVGSPNSSSKETSLPQAPTGNKQSIYEIVANQQKEEQKSKKKAKWSLGPQIAPVYFDAWGSGSPIDQSLEANQKSGEFNLSYGLAVSYAVSKRLRISSGIHKVNYGYDTEAVGFKSALQASANGTFTNIDYTPSSDFLPVDANTKIPATGAAIANDASAKLADPLGVLSQEMGYIEIPLAIEYALIDKKFGIALSGGFSSLVLVDNTVNISADGLTSTVGRANNLNQFNFSTNIGFGINYDFTPKFQITLEPMFKYQMNTFQNVSGDFNPYTLGVYSGLNFKF